jgi:hypothetical protein
MAPEDGAKIPEAGSNISAEAFTASPFGSTRAKTRFSARESGGDPANARQKTTAGRTSRGQNLEDIFILSEQ